MSDHSSIHDKKELQTELSHTRDVEDEKYQAVQKIDDDQGGLTQITLPSLLLGIGICVGGFLFGYDILF